MGKTSLFGSNHLLFSVAQAPSTHLVRPSGLCPYSQLVPSHLTDLVVIHDEDKYSRFNEIDVHAYGFASQAIGNQNSREKCNTTDNIFPIPPKHWYEIGSYSSQSHRSEGHTKRWPDWFRELSCRKVFWEAAIPSHLGIQRRIKQARRQADSGTGVDSALVSWFRATRGTRDWCTSNRNCPGWNAGLHFGLFSKNVDRLLSGL